jgi:hypothetical protein
MRKFAKVAKSREKSRKVAKIREKLQKLTRLRFGEHCDAGDGVAVVLLGEACDGHARAEEGDVVQVREDDAQACEDNQYISTGVDVMITIFGDF